MYLPCVANVMHIHSFRLSLQYYNTQNCKYWCLLAVLFCQIFSTLTHVKTFFKKSIHLQIRSCALWCDVDEELWPVFSSVCSVVFFQHKCCCFILFYFCFLKSARSFKGEKNTNFPFICIVSLLCSEYTSIIYTFGYLCVYVC